MKRSTLIGTVVAVALVVAAVVAFGNKGGNNPATTPTPSPQDSPAAASPSSSPDSAANSSATVTYDGTSFSPASVTVSAGGKVTFVNSSSQEVEVDSNPHPVHTSNAELNVGAISPGQSKTVTVTTKGSFDIHNHLRSAQGGHVTVE